MVLRQGITMTDPQFQEGTTMTQEIMRGGTFLAIMNMDPIQVFSYF